MRKLICLLITTIIAFSFMPAVAHADSWDDGYETGFDEGYQVGWADAECAMEYGDNGYGGSSRSYSLSDLDDAYNEGEEWGYQRGYDDGRADALKEDIAPRISEARKETLIIAIVVYFLFLRSIVETIIENIQEKFSNKKS